MDRTRVTQGVTAVVVFAALVLGGRFAWPVADAPSVEPRAEIEPATPVILNAAPVDPRQAPMALHLASVTA